MVEQQLRQRALPRRQIASGYGCCSGTTGSSATTRSFAHCLDPDFLLGGNGAGWACSGYTRYYGTIPDGDCTVADAAMWEDAGHFVYDAAGWDRYIPYFDGWIKSGVAEGRQKYGIMAEYGTCGTGNLGHPLTPTDERLGLAMATIGGIDLWAVHDCDWNTTVVPGGQFSIPEMGDSAEYPRGWLGEATSDPIRVDTRPVEAHASRAAGSTRT